MSSHEYRQVQFSPRMYPETDHPIPPVRADIQQSSQNANLLPRAPPRMDLEEQNNFTTAHQENSSCNYNRYATKKTISHGLLGFALLTSNIMQLRTLIAQKQRDGIWIASLILVCFSLLLQIILAYILVIVGKGNIQIPHKQRKLENYNNASLFLTTLISIMNVIINAFMTSTNPNSYLDLSLLETSTNST